MIMGFILTNLSMHMHLTAFTSFPSLISSHSHLLPFPSYTSSYFHLCFSSFISSFLPPPPSFSVSLSLCPCDPINLISITYGSTYEGNVPAVTPPKQMALPLPGTRSYLSIVLQQGVGLHEFPIILYGTGITAVWGRTWESNNSCCVFKSAMTMPCSEESIPPHLALTFFPSPSKMFPEPWRICYCSVI